MTATRMTGAMKRSLELRLEELEVRIASLDAQREGDHSLETTALMIQLTRERAEIADALRDARLIDDEPFDFEAIEVGDLVTIRADDGIVDSYVLVADGVGARARSDWVSVTSPLGRAILGRSKGERVEVQSPQGPVGYVVVDFERASERSFVPDRDHAGGNPWLPAEAFIG